MSQSLPVALAIFLDLLKLITSQQAHKTVLLLGVLGEKAERNQQKDQ